ncbi:MAG: tetraacyldisaccharide 4'-kinase [Dysgonamonadaceae bacterium]|nr:tetraacyldisaccharide 4'-kinase [Dysgonamonadaceae bacterium]
MNNVVGINKALLPLSWLYGTGVALRNYLFDRGILRSERFPVPVISIGNLAAGGTGKTPHTEYLIRLLTKQYKVAVLSRGYKRKTRGFVLADASASARTLGDEPFQMFRKFPDILVAVDSNRKRGIETLLALPDDRRPKVILLDDAFQHRRVQPSLSILLTDSNRLFHQDALLPAGRLREPAKNNSRADILIYTKCNRPKELPGWKQDKTFATYYKYKGLLPVFPAVNFIKKENLEHLKKENYSFLLIAGLANPSDLIRYLKQYTEDLHTIIFSDHHNFSRRNIVRIVQFFKNIKSSRKIIITSEKDAMRLISHPAVPEEMKKFMYYLPVEVGFQEGQEEIFTQKIKDHVKDFARNRIMA